MVLISWLCQTCCVLLNFGDGRSQTACCMQARNVHKMELVEGHGNEFVSGRAREGDAINRVYVLDSDELPLTRPRCEATAL